MDATLLRTENHFLGMPIRLLKIDAIRFISWRKKMKREKVIFSFQVSLYRVLPYYAGWIYIRSFGCRANQDFLCLHKSAQEDNTRTPPLLQKKKYTRHTVGSLQHSARNVSIFTCQTRLCHLYPRSLLTAPSISPISISRKVRSIPCAH